MDTRDMLFGAYRASSEVEPTHLILTGGKLHVPDDRAGAFLNEYANAVARAVRHAGPYPAVVELKTPVFRLFVDIDHPEDWNAVVTRCIDVAREAFPGCSTPPVVLHNPVSGGVHLVFPDVFVTSATALAFRDRVLDGCPDLHKVIDACVYRANGLRMPWSIKGRDAAVTAVYSVGDTTASCVRDTLRTVSVRAPGASPSDTTLPTTDDDDTTCTRQKTKAKHVSSAFLRALERCLPKCFGGDHLVGVQQLSDDGEEPVLVIRSSSSVCGNLGFKAHRTNTVYFVVNFKRKTVHQRCYCRCETTDHRLHGYCRDYASPEYRVPQRVLDDYFAPRAPPPPANPLEAILRRGSRYTKL